LSPPRFLQVRFQARSRASSKPQNGALTLRYTRPAKGGTSLLPRLVKETNGVRHDINPPTHTTQYKHAAIDNTNTP